MDPNNKGNNPPDDFGKVIDTLHSKQKLPSLRTYQGDMAEFIKEKNESVISVAVKEKEKKEKKLEFSPKPKVKSNWQMNLIIAISSLLLLVGGATAFFYVSKIFNKEPAGEVIIEQEIIPYNNLIALANVTIENFGQEIAKISPKNGINIIKISDTNGRSFPKAKDLISFLKISLPPALLRNIRDGYAIGLVSQDGQTSRFIVIAANDFGIAFSTMLDWEGSMEKDLSFLNTATSTEVFSWRDVIIKNKDTRALVDSQNNAKLAYTFLDKNTILITNNLSAIGDISSAYASRSFAR